MFTFAQDMTKAINDMDEYSWKRGIKGGLDLGFPQLTQAFEGLTTGLFLVAGSSNTGKSGMMIQLAWQILQSNPDQAVCLYFSLDDNINDILPRVIAMDQKIPVNAVSKPARYEHLTELIARRTTGLNRLRESAGWFNMKDSASGSSIEYIKKTTETYYKEVKAAGKQLVVFIDNFHDITTENGKLNADNKLRYDHIATELTDMCTIFDIPILCTAELRKLNGNRRPSIDDLRESVKIAYIAKAILLCYNEVGLKGENAEVYYTRPGSPDKFPVLEIHIGKNKYSSFKGRVFYEFIPEFSCLKEVPPEGAQTYLSQIT